MPQFCNCNAPLPETVAAALAAPIHDIGLRRLSTPLLIVTVPKAESLPDRICVPVPLSVRFTTAPLALERLPAKVPEAGPTIFNVMVRAVGQPSVPPPVRTLHWMVTLPTCALDEDPMLSVPRKLVKGCVTAVDQRDVQSH